MSAVVTKIDAISKLYEDTGEPYHGAESYISALKEGMGLIFERLNRALSGSHFEKLQQSSARALVKLDEAYKTLIAKMAEAENEAQAVSQVEIEKLKKRLCQIEEDLESKDKMLLEQETQMLTLTD